MEFKLSNRLLGIFKAATWLAYTFFLVYLVVSSKHSEIIEGVVLSAAVLQLSVVSFLNNWHKYGAPLLIDWIKLATFLFVVLNFYMLCFDENIFDFISDRILLEINSISLSILVILVGLLALDGGRLLVNLMHLKRGKSPFTATYKLRNPLIFYVFAISVSTIQIYLMLSGVLGYGSSEDYTTSNFSSLIIVVQNVGPFLLLVFSVLKFIYRYKEKWFDSFFISFLLLQLMYGFLSGMKETIIAPFVMVLIPYLKGGFKIPKKHVLVGIISLLIVYPINNNYRDILNGSPGISRDLAIVFAFERTFGIGLIENLNSGGESFSDRLSLFPYLVYSVQNEEEWTYYKNKDRYIYLPIAWFMPRAVLENKPKSDTGRELNKIIYGYETNSLTVTTYGWAYLEGGLFYVFFLFLVFGVALSLVERYSNKNMLTFLVYVTILVGCLKIESDIYFRLSGLFQIIVIYYILYNIFIVSQRKLHNG